ncbi:MAG TPA: hypothetical protein VM782_06395 [Stellaceae bacterium]|nr:hypothetical protein [Stellaceae bacterium]
MIVQSRGFLREADQAATGDICVAYLVPAPPGEDALRVVRVNLGFVLEALDFLSVDPVQRKADANRLPARGHTGIECPLRREPSAKKVRRISLVAELAG